MLITWDSSPTTATPVPSDSPAVSSGRSMERNDPNARNRTTAAARKPKPRLGPLLFRLPALAI